MASTKRDPYAISEDLDPSTELQGEKVIFDDFVESVEYFLTILEIQSTHQLLDQSTSLDQYITLHQPHCFWIILHVNPVMNLMGLLNVKSG